MPVPRHAPSKPEHLGTYSSNIVSADAVSRRVLYYYYVVPIAWRRQRIEWELWLKGARHAGSPETMLCNSGAVQRAQVCARYCPADADKPQTALDFEIKSACGPLRVESTKNVFSASELGTMPLNSPRTLHTTRVQGRADRQTRLFSLRPLKTRYADPLECWTQEQGRAGRQIQCTSIGR